MNHPAFFDQAPAITVHDGLAAFSRCVRRWPDTYRYSDAVRQARHFCPTVAGAYLMTRRVLAGMVPNSLVKLVVFQWRYMSDFRLVGEELLFGFPRLLIGHFALNGQRMRMDD